MEQDNHGNNNTRRSSSSSFQDAQGHWYSHLTTSLASSDVLTTANSTVMSTPTITSEMETEVLSTDIDDNDHRSQQTTATIHSQRLSEEWLPHAASTPIVTVPNLARSQQDDENELFTNIEQLIQDFTQQPNRRYPLTRVIQWTTVNEEQPQMEYVVVVVINRPAIIL